MYSKMLDLTFNLYLWFELQDSIKMILWLTLRYKRSSVYGVKFYEYG